MAVRSEVGLDGLHLMIKVAFFKAFRGSVDNLSLGFGKGNIVFLIFECLLFLREATFSVQSDLVFEKVEARCSPCVWRIEFWQAMSFNQGFMDLSHSEYCRGF